MTALPPLPESQSTTAAGGFCAIPHNVLRGLGAHPDLGAEARITLTILSFTYAFRRNGGEAAISWSQLAQRSGVDRRFARDIVERLVKDGVISVKGTGTAARIYSFTMRPTTHSTMRPTTHSPEDDSTHSTGSEHAQQGGLSTHSTMRPTTQTREEEKNSLRTSEERDGPQKLKNWNQDCLNALLATKARCDREGEAFGPLQEARLQELVERMELAS